MRIGDTRRRGRIRQNLASVQHVARGAFTQSVINRYFSVSLSIIPVSLFHENFSLDAAEAWLAPAVFTHIHYSGCRMIPNIVNMTADPVTVENMIVLVCIHYLSMPTVHTYM